MTWDFCSNEYDLFTLKIAKSGGAYHANIVTSNGEVIAKISRAYSGLSGL